MSRARLSAGHPLTSCRRGRWNVSGSCSTLPSRRMKRFPPREHARQEETAAGSSWRPAARRCSTTGVPSWGTGGINRDISERKRAEEALAFERSQLLSIFDSIDDVVYVTDPYTYEVLYANKAIERFGGDLVGGICYREFQRRDSPCDFCTNPIILKEKGKPYQLGC